MAQCLDIGRRRRHGDGGILAARVEGSLQRRLAFGLVPLPQAQGNEGRNQQ
jgi:hypothetical protein